MTTHKRRRLTRECVRLGVYLLIWVVVATGTIVEVIVESQGLAARITIAALAWFGGIITYRLANMLWHLWKGDALPKRQ